MGFSAFELQQAEPESFFWPHYTYNLHGNFEWTPRCQKFTLSYFLTIEIFAAFAENFPGCTKPSSTFYFHIPTVQVCILERVNVLPSEYSVYVCYVHYSYRWKCTKQAVTYVGNLLLDTLYKVFKLNW